MPDVSRAVESKEPQDVAAPTQYRIGIDENGLGARLGPLLVTAVAAEVSERGRARLTRKLPKSIARDLNDSKQLLSFGNHRLGEAWARVLCPDARTPAELVERTSADSTQVLTRHCPSSALAQCWTTDGEGFSADEEVLARVARHVEWLRVSGIELRCARAKVLCVGELNRLRESGVNRFGADLHAMERLVLELRERARRPIVATCGKVGGITDYPKHFGPLSGRLHVALEQRRARSSYRFPGLGELHFLQDADGADPLVMLASMVGKYLRELLMGRISSYYTSSIKGLASASGYHDPVTAKLVQLTAKSRKRQHIPESCFERASDS